MCNPQPLRTMTGFPTVFLSLFYLGLQSSTVCSCHGTNILVLEMPLNLAPFFHGSTHIRSFLNHSWLTPPAHQSLANPFFHSCLVWPPVVFADQGPFSSCYSSIKWENMQLLGLNVIIAHVQDLSTGVRKKWLAAVLMMRAFSHHFQEVVGTD